MDEPLRGVVRVYDLGSRLDDEDDSDRELIDDEAELLELGRISERERAQLDAPSAPSCCISMITPRGPLSPSSNGIRLT